MQDVPYQYTAPASHSKSVLTVKDNQVFAKNFAYKLVNPAAVKQTALTIMEQVTGWCSPSKGSVLVDLILKNKPEKIVEIGVWGGRSLVPMAYALKELEHGKIYGIDPWDNDASVQGLVDEANRTWWGGVDHLSVLFQLRRIVEHHNLENYIELIQATSENAPPIYDIDMLHIDGNHSEESALYDVMKWVPLVKNGGWIFFDDLHWVENGHYSTAKAVEWLNVNCIKIAELSNQDDHSDWGIWTKP